MTLRDLAFTFGCGLIIAIILIAATACSPRHVVQRSECGFNTGHHCDAFTVKNCDMTGPKPRDIKGSRERCTFTREVDGKVVSRVNLQDTDQPLSSLLP